MIPEANPTFSFYCRECHFPVVQSQRTMDTGTGQDSDCLVEKHTWSCLNYHCRRHERSENKVPAIEPPAWVGYGDAPTLPTVGFLMARLRCDRVHVRHQQPIIKHKGKAVYYGVLYGLLVKDNRVEWYCKKPSDAGFTLHDVTRLVPGDAAVYSTTSDGIWVTKAGEWWPVRQMTTRHLLNSLRLCKKAAIVAAATDSARNVFLSTMFDNEDIAVDISDHVPSDDPDDTPADGWLAYVPEAFEAMRTEAARRISEKTGFDRVHPEDIGEFYVISDADNKLLMSYEATFVAGLFKKNHTTQAEPPEATKPKRRAKKTRRSL